MQEYERWIRQNAYDKGKESAVSNFVFGLMYNCADSADQDLYRVISLGRNSDELQRGCFNTGFSNETAKILEEVFGFQDGGFRLAA